LERETGFEPATSTLARLHSTTELLPHRKLLFILCPRVLSTGRGYEISNVSKSQNREEKTFVIVHLSIGIAKWNPDSTPNIHWAISGRRQLTNDK
jgi:hypothetical protein